VPSFIGLVPRGVVDLVAPRTGWNGSQWGTEASLDQHPKMCWTDADRN
jgi:hypothetical protein